MSKDGSSVQGKDPTIQDLMDKADEFYAKKPLVLRDLRYSWKRIESVLPGFRSMRASQIEEELRAEYERLIKDAEPNGEAPSDTTLKLDWGSVIRLLTIEADSVGHTTREAAKHVGMREWEPKQLRDEGIFRQSLRPLAHLGRRKARWSDDDIRALETWKVLRDAGFVRRELTEVGTNVRAAHPELAMDGEYNNAVFAFAKLVPWHGDIHQFEDGKRISRLARPGHEVCLDRRLLEGFVETVYLPQMKLLSRKYVRRTRDRLRTSILVKLGHLPLSELVTYQHLADYVSWLDSVEPRLPSVEKEDRLDTIVRVLSAAQFEGEYTGALPEKPIVPRTEGTPEGGLPAPEEIKEILARQCQRGDEIGAAWLLLKTITGLAPREIVALSWGCAAGLDIKIRTLFLRPIGHDRRKGLLRANTKQAREIPLPAPLARLLSKLRAQAEFSGDNDLVFPKSGDTPLIQRESLERFIYPVTDEMELSRRLFGKLENEAGVLAADAGLTSQQIASVLKVGRGLKVFPRPTPKDLEDTRIALEKAIRRVLPPELMYLCEGKPVTTTTAPAPMIEPQADPAAKLAKEIAAAMDSAGHTQEQAAEAMGVSDRFLRDVLAGIKLPRQGRTKRAMNNYKKKHLR